jgi:hypothetical protein
LELTLLKEKKKKPKNIKLLKMNKFLRVECFY